MSAFPTHRSPSVRAAQVAAKPESEPFFTMPLRNGLRITVIRGNNPFQVRVMRDQNDAKKVRIFEVTTRQPVLRATMLEARDTLGLPANRLLHELLKVTDMVTS